MIVTAWAVVVVGVFVWRGDLRLAAGESPSGAGESVAAAEPPAAVRPVVVYRPNNERPKPKELLVRRGRVFDALGFLIVGAEIVPMHGPALRSDGDGSFQLEVESTAAADLLVRADDKLPKWVRTSSGSPDEFVVQLEPAAPWDAPPSPLPPPPALFGEGTVRRHDGQPLAGAYVTARDGLSWARSDDLGRFVLPLSAPTAELLVHDPEGGIGRDGFFGKSEPIAIGRDRGTVPLPDLTAAPGIAIRGIVRCPRGEPLAGVPVEVVGGLLHRVTATADGGAFHVGGLVAGDYTVRPFAFRGAIGAASRVTLGNASVDVDVQLHAADERRLRVVDEHGAAVAGVFVAASVAGTRRGVAQADLDGFVAVPVGQATEFDVRTTEQHATVAVRRFDADAATLVVAMP